MIVYRVKTQDPGVKEWTLQPDRYSEVEYGSTEAAKRTAQDVALQFKATGQRAVLMIGG